MIRSSRSLAQALCLAAAILALPAARAFESDVHFGLTEWLAIQAGFDEQAAQTIATGNQRVDSGDMQYEEMAVVNACVAHDPLGASLIGEHHYPSAGKIPGAPDTRPVAAGSDAAKKAALAVTRIDASKSSFMLFMLGEGLHELQDSWSHQGIADVPAPALLSCDPLLAWGHPKARGGWNSHKADLTMFWPADTVAMAEATYQMLKQYPPLDGVKRTAKPWDDLRPLVEKFARASTKAEKKEWFARQNIADASFLEGISLKDGAVPFTLRWEGRKLPPLESPQSRQHDLDSAVLDFYNRFFESWMKAGDFNRLAADFGAKSTARAELAARLKIWRMRDHGRVAALAHSDKPLSAADRSSVDALGRDPRVYAVYDTVADAFFPFLPRTKDVSPLLPFFIKVWNEGATARAVAVVRLHHAPYDNVAVVSQRTGDRWGIVSITATVDH